MGPVSSHPEHVLGMGHSELDPVLDGNILDLDGTSLHCVLQDLVASVVSDCDIALGSNLEGLVVASKLLGLLNHQPHFGKLTIGGVVKLTLLLAVLDDGVIDIRVHIYQG